MSYSTLGMIELAWKLAEPDENFGHHSRAIGSKRFGPAASISAMCKHSAMSPGPLRPATIVDASHGDGLGPAPPEVPGESHFSLHSNRRFSHHQLLPLGATTRCVPSWSTLLQRLRARHRCVLPRWPTPYRGQLYGVGGPAPVTPEVNEPPGTSASSQATKNPAFLRGCEQLGT